MYQRDFQKRVRLGVVGLGSHTYRNLLPTLTHLPVELVAVCDLDAGRARTVGTQYGATAYSDPAAMYEREGLDAVLIAVSPRLHPTLARQAFDAGVHAWMEKPAALTVDEVHAMIAARGRLVGMVGLKKAFMPATRKAVELVGRDDAGALISALGVYKLSIPTVEEETISTTDSLWLGNGSHPLSVLVEVGGPVGALTTHRGRHGGGALILEHTSGAVSTLHLAHGAHQSQPHERYSFFCSAFQVDIDNSARVVLQRGIPFDYSYGDTFAPAGTEHGALVWEAQHSYSTLENKSLFLQGVYHELRRFCECVLDGATPVTGSLEQAAHVTDIYQVAMRSVGDRRELTTTGLLAAAIAGGRAPEARSA